MPNCPVCEYLNSSWSRRCPECGRVAATIRRRNRIESRRCTIAATIASVFAIITCLLSRTMLWDLTSPFTGVAVGTARFALGLGRVALGAAVISILVRVLTALAHRRNHQYGKNGLRALRSCIVTAVIALLIRASAEIWTFVWEASGYL